jgi:hypothetical protein
MTYNVKIDIISDNCVTREANPEDRWDVDDLDWNHDIRGFKVVEKKEYWDFVMENNPKGKSLYLVYVLYNTGDSFHLEENLICLVGLYEDVDDAKTVMHAIKSDYTKNSEKFYPIDVNLPKKGTTETICTASWKGYFTSLNSVNLEQIVESVNV